MGYNFTIGNAVLEYTAGDEHMRITVESAVNDNAPNHCPYTGKGNSRSPSYSGWSDFCKTAGIEELFYGKGWSREESRYLDCPEGFHRETPLLAEHPGAFPLTADDLAYIIKARVRREQSNRGRPPGFWGDDNVDNGNDHALARLLWLEFWIDWALKNCERPAISNT